LGFGIRTPGAAKGAAFEKDHGSDARAVVDAEFLNVKKNALNRHGLTIGYKEKKSNMVVKEWYLSFLRK
jgi:hypothetical protein